MAILMKTKIKEYREKFLMTQNELAKLVGVRRETIVHLENGKYNPSLKLAMDIAKVFDTTVENLLNKNSGKFINIYKMDNKI
ncbi:transcriptional regulator [Clostridioides difficile]|nr:transcriptional regulator [Clostridioides difficile]VII24750.1 transcriptional regulator [Clostridioides difficile]VII31435.1 transcriptional regulator [Clostridioides difficile]